MYAQKTAVTKANVDETIVARAVGGQNNGNAKRVRGSRNARTRATTRVQPFVYGTGDSSDAVLTKPEVGSKLAHVHEKLDERRVHEHITEKHDKHVGRVGILIC